MKAAPPVFYGDGAGSGRDRQLLAAIRHIDTGP
jgi:hypothetical protein